LRPGRGGPDPVAAGDGPVLEQPAVAGEHDAPLAGRRRDDRGVGGVVGVARIEAQEPEVAGQPPQVHVEDEPRLPQRPRPQPGGAGDVQALEHGVDRHAVAVAERMAEAHRFAVDEDQVHLRVGHAQRLDGVLDRRAAVERVGEIPLASRRRQEVVEFLVEAELGVVLRSGVIGKHLIVIEPQRS